ncbi:PLP-dependent aminotransferase family protein [Leucobacter chromiireducens]|uniref:PLP-dependent aminotransferase family protein n=1 Tax=Leucobacter chromiireducens subsp. solipictus TaxID=398235 RepID=A0ABS1SBF0_9MICO|nr:PLP-dependent aminotransferase family protein [Leucobacter chromiireducens]MBL3677825.1 PLP-dependent aminotransferase family protein [Leucobacter chromiireducens subsp. solipictus]
MSQSSTDRIIAELERWIAQAAPGSRLPGSRQLAESFGAGPVTVQRAMHALAARGLIESRPGVGTFVRRRDAACTPDYGWQTGALGALPTPALPVPETQREAAPGTIEMHSGYPCAELLPAALVRAATARAARSPHALHRAPAAGLPELQAWFATELSGSGPAPHAPREAIIVPGTQSALGSIFRALVGRGRPMVIESPSYWGALRSAAQQGVTLVPISTTPGGPDPQELDRALRESGARVFYAQPTFANPLGGSWHPDRAGEILTVLRAHDAFLIEDDWARDFAIDTRLEQAPRPLGHDDPDGRIVTLRSLTKSLSPALRVGALIARGPARDRLLADRVADTMYVSPLLQATALDAVTSPGWRAHRAALPERLRHRRDLLLDSLAQYSPDVRVDAVPQGGLSVWARLPAGSDPNEVARQCAARGLALASGDAWFPAEPSTPALRLTFCGPEPERFPEAAQILAGVLSGN